MGKVYKFRRDFINFEELNRNMMVEIVRKGVKPEDVFARVDNPGDGSRTFYWRCLQNRELADFTAELIRDSFRMRLTPFYQTDQWGPLDIKESPWGEKAGNRIKINNELRKKAEEIYRLLSSTAIHFIGSPLLTEPDESLIWYLEGPNQFQATTHSL